jgi:hypothetical protein
MRIKFYRIAELGGFDACVDLGKFFRTYVLKPIVAITLTVAIKIKFLTALAVNAFETVYGTAHHYSDLTPIT